MKNVTKIECPVCGNEINVVEEQPNAKLASKAAERIEALKKAGIDTSSMFAMESGEIMRVTGGIAKVMSEDELVNAILKGDVVQNKHLFRRWVMAQTFRMMASKAGFTKSLRDKGCAYMFHVISDEILCQLKLFKRDTENYKIRNTWFNAFTIFMICSEYCDLCSEYIGGYFSNWYKEHLDNLYSALERLRVAYSAVEYNNCYKNIQIFANAFEDFRSHARFFNNYKVEMPKIFIDCYKGVGAYYTMQNMLLFHGATFNNMNKEQSIKYLNVLNNSYGPEMKGCREGNLYLNQEGWRMHGLMKKLISDSNIDIVAKLNGWSKYSKY